MLSFETIAKKHILVRRLQVFYLSTLFLLVLLGKDPSKNVNDRPSLFHEKRKRVDQPLLVGQTWTQLIKMNSGSSFSELH